MYHVPMLFKRKRVLKLVSVLGPETTALIAAGLLVFLNAIWTGGEDMLRESHAGGQPGPLAGSYLSH